MALKKKIPERPRAADLTDPDGVSMTKLIEQAKKGNERAIEGLIEETKLRLFRFCYHLCGSKMLAEEVAQETYIKALSNLDSINNGNGFYSWLFRVAKNHFIDQVRSAEGKMRSREVGAVGNDDDSPLDTIADRNPSDMHTFLEVQRVLASLPDDDRMAILLVDHEEYSYEEAAKIMGVSMPALRSRLQRAREKFLEEYREEKS